MTNDAKLRPIVTYDGQKFYDKPIVARPKFIVIQLAKAWSLPILPDITVAHERTYILWQRR